MGSKVMSNVQQVVCLSKRKKQNYNDRGIEPLERSRLQAQGVILLGWNGLWVHSWRILDNPGSSVFKDAAFSVFLDWAKQHWRRKIQASQGEISFKVSQISLQKRKTQAVRVFLAKFFNSPLQVLPRRNRRTQLNKRPWGRGMGYDLVYFLLLCTLMCSFLQR